MSGPKQPRPVTPLLRKALWEAHKHRCAYDGAEITELDRMQVDHILPQWLWQPDAREDLASITSVLALDPSYHPDSLDNLLPVRVLRNKQKGAWLFEEADARFFRKIAKEKSEEVEHLCQKLEDEAEQERIRSEAVAACSANPKLKDKLLAALALTAPFAITNQVSNRQARFARPRVRIEAHLPDSRGFGSALIHINTLYLHRVLITFDARQILDTLLPGWGSPPELQQRRFVMGLNPDQPDEWIVNLGGTTVFLTTEELHQLCDVVDSFAPVLLNAVLAKETAEGTLPFAPDGQSNVRLLSVRRGLWSALLEFAREHDYANGDSPWHIFDASGHGHIKIVRRTDQGDVIPFDAYIYPAPADSISWGGMTRPDDEVCLCWDRSQSLLRQETAHVGWTAEATHRWLAEKLIPEVVRRFPEGKPSLLDRIIRRVSTGQPPSYFSETEGLDPAVFHSVADWPELFHLTELAQVFYNCHPGDPVHRRVIESALAGLLLLGETLPVKSEHLNYYAQKLGVPCAGELPRLVAAAQDDHHSRATFDGFDLDNILRCAWGVLRDHAPTSGTQLQPLANVVAAFIPLVTAFRYDAIRDRTLRRLEDRSLRDA